MTPRTIDARGSYIDISPSELDHTNLTEYHLFPSDHNIIKAFDAGENGSWISVSTPWNDVFGLRKEKDNKGALFRVSFSDYTQVVVSANTNTIASPNGSLMILPRNSIRALYPVRQLLLTLYSHPGLVVLKQMEPKT